MYLIPYQPLDKARRWVGGYLDVLGLGPSETPFRVAFADKSVTLRSYYTHSREGPILLIVPAPIKRPYLWDALPDVSVVQRCIDGNINVYLTAWEEPRKGEQGLGLTDYADDLLLRCLDVIRSETGQQCCFVAGHSLGGTLAAIFSSLHGERLNGLILLGAPLHFGPRIGVLGPLTAMGLRAQAVTAILGNVPGSFLNAVCLAASPTTFGSSRWMDWVNSLGDPEALRTHLLVERWSLDEVSLPRRLFEDVVELLYREDRFMRGELRLKGQRAAPDAVDVPLLSVLDPRCALAPPEAVLPFHRAVASADTKILEYPGDTGVSLQHVGMLVGRKAHQLIWPGVIRWIHAHGAAK